MPFPNATSTLTFVPLGVHAKAYRKVSAAYQELKNASGLKIANSRSAVKITRKGDGQNERTIAGMKARSVTFVLRDVRLDEADSQEVFAIAAAYEDGTPLDLLLLDASIQTANAFGWAGDWTITQFDRNEEDNGDVHWQVTAEPAPSAGNGVRAVYVATGGTLTNYEAEEEE